MWPLLLVSVFISSVKATEEEEGLQKMTFTPPQLSEEEQKSVHLPQHLKCDACIAIGYTLHLAFAERHKNINTPQWKLNHGDVLGIFEKVCTYDGLSKYGISADEENGINRLKGPGVFEAPGAAHMGGRLPFQLSEECERYRDADESLIYSAWIQGGKTERGIQEFLCFNKKYKGEDGDLELDHCGSKHQKSHKNEL